jgi:hypothetical protein
MFLFFAMFLMMAVGMALAPSTYKGEQNGQGRFFEYLVLDGLAPSAELSSGTTNSDHIDLGANRGCIEVTLDVTAINGSPTLDVTVQHSHDASTWATLGTMTQATGVGTETKIFGPARRYLRFSQVVGGTGTPKETRSITGKAF